jgi:hypothetical protein
MVLSASAAAVTGACAASEPSGRSSRGPNRTAQTAPGAQTDAVRDRALAAEADLLARYDAALALPTVTTDSTLTARLTAIRAEHASHAAAIKDGYQTGAVATPTPTTSSSTSPPPSPPTSTSTSTSPPTPAPSGPTTAPPDAKSTVAALIKAEQDAAGARTADILAADGATAMLLASVAAAESGHAALLLGGAA